MASNLTVESRFCRFQVPASWKVAKGAGAFEDRPLGPSCSAVVTECWVDPALSAREFAAKQVALALEMLEGFEVVGEGPAEASRFADAWTGTYRTPGQDGGHQLQHQLTVVSGHLVCCLTWTGAEPDRTRWAPILGEVVSSFEIPAAASLGGLGRQALLAAAEPPGEELAPLARLQLLVPVPRGWALDEGALTLHGPGKNEITFRAAEPAGVALDQAFADALARLAREAGQRAVAWDQGELAEDRRWYALDAIRAAATKWGSRDERLRRQVLLDDEGVLEICLHAGAQDAGALEVFSRVVAGVRRQPPGQRRLQVQEPWVPAVLEGAWREFGPGVFMHLAPPQTLVVATRQPGSRGLRPLAEASALALREQPEVASVDRQELVEGAWKGRQAMRYALDFQTAEGQPLALRAVWLDGGDAVCHFMVRGEDTDVVERLFIRLLEAVEPQRMKGASRP